MGILKGVLREELENSLRIKERFEEALADLPKGSLIKKNIKGHDYYYLVLRENKKIKFIYKGKVSDEEIKKYAKAKANRARYRKSVSQTKKQIRFLKSALRGKVGV